MFKYMRPEGTVLLLSPTPPRGDTSRSCHPHLPEQFASILARAPTLSHGQMFSEQLLSVSLEDVLVSWTGTHCIKGTRYHTWHSFSFMGIESHLAHAGLELTM